MQLNYLFFFKKKHLLPLVIPSIEILYYENIQRERVREWVLKTIFHPQGFDEFLHVAVNFPAIWKNKKKTHKNIWHFESIIYIHNNMRSLLSSFSFYIKDKKKSFITNCKLNNFILFKNCKKWIREWVGERVNERKISETDTVHIKFFTIIDVKRGEI
jgi:hypothetical protein